MGILSWLKTLGGSDTIAEASRLRIEQAKTQEAKRATFQSVMKAAAASIKTLLRKELQEKYDLQSVYAANSGLIACMQQVLENQRVIIDNQRFLQRSFGELVEIVNQLRPGPAVQLSIEEDLDMAITIGADGSKKLKITPRDKHGNPATVDGVPAWSSSDESLLTVTPSDDGLKATVAAVGPVGTAQVVVTADADLGDGVTPLTGTLDVTIVAGQATELGVEIDPEA